MFDQLKIILFEGDVTLRSVADRFNELKRERGEGIPRAVWERHGAHYPAPTDHPTPVPEHKRSGGSGNMVAATRPGAGGLPSPLASGPTEEMIEAQMAELRKTMK